MNVNKKGRKKGRIQDALSNTEHMSLTFIFENTKQITGEKGGGIQSGMMVHYVKLQRKVTQCI